MDLWAILLTTAALCGILGWTTSLFTNGVYWFCEWREGRDINWGSDVAFTLFVPFAWLFAIFEITLLYCM